MGMLSVCYVKVKIVLNKCKIEMLSLGYRYVKTKLRQNCSHPHQRTKTAIRALVRVRIRG